MSRKRDLIERVRYPNPIPIPPFPPKLVQLDNPSSNYAHPDFSTRLANAHPIPTVVDAQAGMNLNLLDFQGVWNGAANHGFADQSVAPISSPNLDPTDLDPEDAYLLSDLSSTLPSSNNLNSSAIPNLKLGGSASNPSQQPLGNMNGAKDVTWLRRTEYLAAEQAKNRVEARKRPTVQIDTSREGHISRIESTFSKASTPLSKLKHPTKSHLKAIDSYEVLPDRDTWSTQYQILKFSDWPGKVAKPTNVNGNGESQTQGQNPSSTSGEGKAIKDERIDLALFRPVMDLHGEQRISLYLPAHEPVVRIGNEKQEGDDDDDGLIENVEGESREEKENRLEKEISRRFNKRRRSGKFPIPKSREEFNRELEKALEGIKDEGERADLETRLEEIESQRHSTSFRFARDYEPMDQGREVRSQLVFVLDDGLPDSEIVSKDQHVRDPHAVNGLDSNVGGGKGKERETEEDRRKTDPVQALEENQYRKSHRIRDRDHVNGNGNGGKKSIKKVAYFHPITMRFGLRIKRLRKHEVINGPKSANPDFWDRISLSHRSLTEREAEKRANVKRDVDEIDLDFIESEVEEDQPAPIQENEQDAEGSEDEEGEAENLIKPSREDEGKEKGIRLGDTIDKSDVQAEDNSKIEKADQGEDEDGEGDADGNSDGDGENQDATDDDDDDDDVQEGESVDGDEELAALAAEAGDAGDEVSKENDQGRRGRRSRSGRTVVDENQDADETEGNEKSENGEEGNENGNQEVRMDLDS